MMSVEIFPMNDWSKLVVHVEMMHNLMMMLWN